MPSFTSQSLRLITCHVPTKCNILQLQLRIKTNIACATLRLLVSAALPPFMQQRWQDKENKVEIMQHLAEGDKKGTMTKDVLTVLWMLAKQDDTFCDYALDAHVKTLELFCERQKNWKVGYGAKMY